MSRIYRRIVHNPARDAGHPAALIEHVAEGRALPAAVAASCGPFVHSPLMDFTPEVTSGGAPCSWTERRDAPERIWLAHIDLSGDWRNWKVSERGIALAEVHLD